METRKIDLFKPFIPETAGPAVLKTLYSGFIGEGPITAEFERQLQDFLHWPYAALVNSGTTALKLALKLAGVQPGDQVITPAQTCWATTSAVLNSGAVPVWADTERDFCNVDIQDIARKITPKVKALIVVHWGGQPVDIQALRELIPPDVKIIQDSAHALGAMLHGRHLPEYGDFSCYSFQAIKHICVGSDGGLVACPDAASYHRAKLLRWFGIDREDKNRLAMRCELPILENGDKYHLNDFCSAIGVEQMKHLDETLRIVRENAVFYDQELAGAPGILSLPPKSYDGTVSSYWLYTVRVDKRADFIHKLAEHGIGANQVHVRNDGNPCVAQFKTELPNLDKLDAEHCSIPVGRWVSPEDRQYIVDVIKSGW